MSSSPTATSQALEALRRADDDNRARASEINLLRQRLAESERQTAAAEEARERAEQRYQAAASDAERQTQALKVVLKEVRAAQDSLDHERTQTARLKSDLASVTAQSQEMRSLLAAKSVTSTHDGTVAHSGAVLYMQHCYTLHADPCPGILRSLFEGSSVVAATDANFQQLAVLLDVIRSAPASVAGAVALEVSCNGDNVSVVCDLIATMRGARRVTAKGVDTMGMEGLADALRLGEHVRELELPGLRVTDSGLVCLLKALNERYELSQSATASPPLAIKDLDLSACAIDDPATALALCALPLVGRLNVSGMASLDKPTLRAALMRCPAVTVLVARNCPKLGVDTCDALNQCPLIRDVDLTGCTGISALRLQHVVTLRTALTAVAVVSCPALVEIVGPCTSFQVVEWSTPHLETLTLHGVQLNVRECTLLSHCGALRSASFVNCRISGLDAFLNRMRKLELISLCGSKGISDADLKCLCTTLTSVDLTDCFCITERGLARLAACPRLEELTVKRCTNLTDAAMAHLQSHESLRYLNALGTKKVTTASLTRLVESCRNLTHVVHETLIAAAIRVDRLDDEDAARRSLAFEERDLHSRKSNLSFAATASPSRPHSPRASTAQSAPKSDL